MNVKKLYPHVKALSHADLLGKVQQNIREDEKHLKAEGSGSNERGWYWHDTFGWDCPCGDVRPYRDKVGEELFAVCAKCGKVYLMTLLKEEPWSMYSDSWHHWNSGVHRTYTFKLLGTVRLETFERTRCESPCCERTIKHKCKCGQQVCDGHWYGHFNKSAKEGRHVCPDCYERENPPRRESWPFRWGYG